MPGPSDQAQRIQQQNLERDQRAQARHQTRQQGPSLARPLTRAQDAEERDRLRFSNTPFRSRAAPAPASTDNRRARRLAMGDSLNPSNAPGPHPAVDQATEAVPPSAFSQTVDPSDQTTWHDTETSSPPQAPRSSSLETPAPTQSQINTVFTARLDVVDSRLDKIDYNINNLSTLMNEVVAFTQRTAKSDDPPAVPQPVDPLAAEKERIDKKFLQDSDAAAAAHGAALRALGLPSEEGWASRHRLRRQTVERDVKPTVPSSPLESSEVPRPAPTSQKGILSLPPELIRDYQREKEDTDARISMERREIRPDISNSAPRLGPIVLNERDWVVPKLTDMPRFDGTPLKTFAWLSQMSIFFLPGAPDSYINALMLQRVPLLLEGSAAIWYHSHPEETRLAWAGNWTTFRALLLDHFLPDKSSLKRWESKRTWRVDEEPVDTYILEKKLLLQQAYPSIHEDMLCAKIVDGLPPGLVLWLDKDFTPHSSVSHFRDQFGQMTSNIKAAVSKWTDAHRAARDQQRPPQTKFSSLSAFMDRNDGTKQNPITVAAATAPQAPSNVVSAAVTAPPVATPQTATASSVDTGNVLAVQQSTAVGPPQITVRPTPPATSSTTKNNSALTSTTPMPKADRRMSYLERTYDPNCIVIISENDQKVRTYSRPDNNKIITLKYPCSTCREKHFTFEHPWLVLREQGHWPPPPPTTMAALPTDCEDPFPNWVEDDAGKAETATSGN